MTKSSATNAHESKKKGASFNEVEAMSVACERFLEGDTWGEIAEKMNALFPGRHFTREAPRKFVLDAARQGLFNFDPPYAQQLSFRLGEAYNWDASRVSVVHSKSFGHVARAAAQKLLWQIRYFATFGKLDTVHIGFAGGRLLRLVAENLADLLQESSDQNPKRIVFHAMVAAFNENDFEADPNNFISYFVRRPMQVEISFLPIAAPGIVETEFREGLLTNYRVIREVFAAAKKLNIIVSSGGDWSDQHSTTQRYLKQVGEDDEKKLRDYPAIGDLLWQPLAADGPIDMDSGGFTYRPNTLVDLKDLPRMIEDNVRVMLVLGPCGHCEKPKGNVLDTILGLDERLVTDVVTNSPTAHQALGLAKTRGGVQSRKAK